MMTALGKLPDGSTVNLSGRTTSDLEREADCHGCNTYRIDLGAYSETIVRISGEWVALPGKGGK